MIDEDRLKLLEDHILYGHAMADAARLLERDRLRAAVLVVGVALFWPGGRGK